MNLIKNRFFVLRFNSGLVKYAIVLCCLSQYFAHRKLNFIAQVGIMKNILFGLAEYGGKMYVILRRTRGISKLYIVICKGSISLKNLNNWIRQTIAYLDNFAEVSNSKYLPLNSNLIREVLLFFWSKNIAISQSRRIELSALKKTQLIAVLKSLPEEVILGKLTDIFANVDIRHNPLDSLNNNQFLMFGIDLNSIKKAIKKASTKLYKKMFDLSVKNVKQRINIKNLIERVDVFLSLYLGQEVSKIDEYVSLNYEVLDKIILFPSVIIGQGFNHSRIRKSKLKMFTAIDEILNGRFKIRLRAPLDISLCYIAAILHILMLTRRKRIEVPVLDICDSASVGDIHIGWQLYAGEPIVPFYLSLSDIQRHVLILGRTGMGKSRLARIILESILDKNHSKIWIFDMHREYTDLASKYDFEIFVPGTLDRPLMINIFQSVNEDPESYSTFLMSLLRETIKLKGDETTSQMERAISYALWATTLDDKPTPVKFFEKLFEWCKNTCSDIPTALYTFYAVANRLKPIFSGVSKNIFWVKKSNVDIEHLKNENVIFDMSFLLKRNLKREILLLVNILLRYIVMSMFKSEIKYDNRPRLCIIVEEGRYLMPWRKIETTIETTAVEDFATLARKYGLGLVVISQSPYTISPDIISNAGTLFMMNAEIPEREYIITEDEKIKKYIQIMPPREAIVRITSHPALVHIKVKEISISYDQGVKLEPMDVPIEEYLIEKPFEEVIKEIMEPKSNHM